MIFRRLGEAAEPGARGVHQREPPGGRAVVRVREAVDGLQGVLGKARLRLLRLRFDAPQGAARGQRLLAPTRCQWLCLESAYSRERCFPPPPPLDNRCIEAIGSLSM